MRLFIGAAPHKALNTGTTFITLYRYELTLEQIAPYSNRLKALCSAGYVIEIYGIDYYKNTVLNVMGERTFHIENIKPILRKLDLTKTILIEGKEIVPLLSLQRLHC